MVIVSAPLLRPIRRRNSLNASCRMQWLWVWNKPGQSSFLRSWLLPALPKASLHIGHPGIPVHSSPRHRQRSPLPSAADFPVLFPRRHLLPGRPLEGSPVAEVEVALRVEEVAEEVAAGGEQQIWI